MTKHNPVLIRNEEDEMRQVRKDLTFVVTLNLFFFVLLLALFFFNKATGKVDAWFAHFLKF